jgi:hypothetical protein
MAQQPSQIVEMNLQGLTPAQIAESLFLEEKDVIAIIEANSAREQASTLDELYEKHQVDAVKTLASIMKSSENDSARVTAAKVLLTRGGNLTDDTMKRLSDRFERMKLIVNKTSFSNRVDYVTTLSADGADGNGARVSLNLQQD